MLDIKWQSRDMRDRKLEMGRYSSLQSSHKKFWSSDSSSGKIMGKKGRMTIS